MAEKNNPYSRSRCEGCGAALDSPDNRGKITCVYCGAVYWRNDQQEPKPSLSTESPIDEQDYVPQNSPDSDNGSSNNKTIVTLILSVVGILIFMCLLFVVLSPKTTQNKRTPAKIIKPEMLSQLPVNPIPAGSQIAYADWGLTVYPEISAKGDSILVGMEITNYQSQERVFLYTPNGIVVKDNLGNIYSPSIGNCEPDLLYFNKQISINPNQTIKINSSSNLCSRSSNFLPLYNGIIPLDARKIILSFEKFGVFNGLNVEIDL